MARSLHLCCGRALPIAWVVVLAGLPGCREGAEIVLGQIGAVADAGPSEPATNRSQLPPEVTSSGFFGLANDGLPLPTCTSTTQVDGPREPDEKLGTACSALVNDLISEFSYSGAGDSTGVNFELGGSFPAGTFFYPDSADALSSDVTQSDWHLTGIVNGVSGFGIYLNGCQMLDASSFQGISFEVWGEIPDPHDIVFFVGSAANQVSNVWLDDNQSLSTASDSDVNLGRCIPPRTQFDGVCREARIAIPVPSRRTVVSVLWDDLGGGCPEVSANPEEITALAWYFPPSSLGAYAVDLHIDNMRFIPNDVN